MSEPRSMDELASLIQQNTQVTGFGRFMADHVPCPFCGMADVLVIPLMGGWPETGTCKHEVQDPAFPDDKSKKITVGCERTVKIVAGVDHTINDVKFSLVQTGGPDQPPWLQPKLRVAK